VLRERVEEGAQSRGAAELGAVDGPRRRSAASSSRACSRPGAAIPRS